MKTLLLTFFFSFIHLATADEIKIGVISPLSGEAAAYGQDAMNAYKMAEEEINASSLLKGRKLRLIFEDGKCNGKDALTAAKKLVTVDKVNIILGGTCSGETLGIIPFTESKNVLVLSSFSSSPRIAKSGKFVFRNAMNDQESGTSTANLLREKGAKRVAILIENTDYAIDAAKAAESRFNEIDVPIVSKEFFNASDTDLKALLLRIKSQTPDSIFISVQTGSKSGLAVRQIRELGINAMLIGNFSLRSLDAMRAVQNKEYMEGVLVIDTPWITKLTGMDFLQRFKERFGAYQSDFNLVFSRDAVYLISKAIASVGLDSNKIREHLLRLPSFEGAAYTYRFSESGDPVGIPWTIAKYSKGQWTDKNI